MSESNGYQQSILWDDVHVLTVNHQQQAIFVSENVGGAPGDSRIKTPDIQIRADMRDPLRVLDMAIRYVIRYDLLARVLDAEVIAVFEQIGVKGFLDQLLGLTTEQLRRDRFIGLDYFEFTVNPKPKGISRVEDDEDEPEDDEEAEVAEPTSVAEVIKTPRRRKTSNT